tara:strand:+ start:306 stop:608 length:303 start_codon:yes stop_codon:yes gene_type:complete
MILSEFLVKADVTLGIVVGEDGANSAQEDGNALVSTRESMIEILKNSYVLSVLFERLESFGHFVVLAGLVSWRKESLLVHSVVVGEAYETLDWFRFCCGG